MRIKRCSCRLLRAPLNQPFRIATGQHNDLENVLFVLELSDGTKGYGEAGIAPHITGESVDQSLRNLSAVGKKLVGRDPADLTAVSQFLHNALPSNKSAVAAVEMSLLDALCRLMRLPLWKFYGTKLSKLTTDITIVIGDLEEARRTCGHYYKQGFRKFKIKIGKDFDLDLQRVVLVAKGCRKSSIYLDANQGFKPKDILRFLSELKRMRVVPQLLEQPVARADWEGLKEVARKSPVPVCADESASSIADILRIIKEKAVPVVNVKIMKTGMEHSRKIAMLCRANGIELMIGAMMESSLSTMASAHLAAGLGCFKYVDLDTPFFIKAGYDRNPYLSASGVYDLKKVKAGIGIIPR